jgi:O-antigen/teichoic acid export membrane protein
MMVRTLAVLLLLCSATRPALADGALNYDDGKIAVALVVLGIVVISGLVLIVWLLRSLGRWVATAQQRRVAEAEFPVARTVKDSRRPE